MNIQLLEGEFNNNDALDLITQMIQIKIKYHESKISNSLIEEDIKQRENKIKRLQENLFEIRNQISNSDKKITISSLINIS